MTYSYFLKLLKKLNGELQFSKKQHRHGLPCPLVSFTSLSLLLSLPSPLVLPFICFPLLMIIFTEPLPHDECILLLMARVSLLISFFNFTFHYLVYFCCFHTFRYWLFVHRVLGKFLSSFPNFSKSTCCRKWFASFYSFTFWVIMWS